MKMKSNQKDIKEDKWLLKAYNNPVFLNSPSARIIRILTEMIEPADRLRKNRVWSTVVFFGSARTKPLKEAQKDLDRIKKEIQKKSRKTKKIKEKLAQAEQILYMSRYYNDAASLSEKLTNWFQTDKIRKHNFYVCSGGGPGIMEAANLGAKKAKGKSIGLNISLPMEQDPNPFQTREISFDFHYFFIRKFWFFYLSKAMVVFPGGFGTCDELFELLTLIQTQKTKKYMPLILFGKEYWEELINFEAFVKWGMIAKEDLKLFKIIDTVDEAFQYLTEELQKHYIK